MEKLEDFIEKTKKIATEKFIPIVRDQTIAKIIEILKEEDYKNILEIGTAIGYSSVIMLSAKNDIFLTTLEKNEERAKIAKENFEKFNFQNRVNLIIGDAFDSLQSLSSKNEKFDFIFLDGPKGQYINYLPFLKNLLESRGTLFADNVLLGGLIDNTKQVTHKNRSMTVNMKKFIDEISNDEQFETVLYKIDDGFLISKLKNNTL